MKIWLDAGHGGNDPGAIGNGLQEKYITLKLVNKIEDLLSDYENVQVESSRSSDRTVSLKERTDAANAWGADFFLSVHVNAGGGEGFESFIYNELSTSSKTAQLQDIIHYEIVKATTWKDRGKKGGNFAVLRETKMPAMLTENGFIDNMSDAAMLKQDVYLSRIALGHVAGLAKAFNLKMKETKPLPVTSPDKMYYVQVGAYADRANAEKMIERLKEAGFPAIIK